MKRNKKRVAFTQGPKPVRARWQEKHGFLLLFLSALICIGCGKKEESPNPAMVAVNPSSPQERLGPEQKGRPPFSYRSLLTKDLNRLIPSSTFTRNDRIYLYTTWTGLSGRHEIKVLFVRPDGEVQETVRIQENVPPTPIYNTWAYLAFKKGLLNITPFEGKFIGRWKAQLFLDGVLLQEYPFTVS